MQRSITKWLLLLSSVAVLSGCAINPFYVPKENVGKSQLVYRHSKPVDSIAAVKYSSNKGKVTSTLTDPDWLVRLDYGSVGAALSETIVAFTDPRRLPLTILFDKIDDLTKVFTQARDVRLAEIESQTQVEETSVWMPEKAERVVVRDGALRVMVEGGK